MESEVKDTAREELADYALGKVINLNAFLEDTAFSIEKKTKMLDAVLYDLTFGGIQEESHPWSIPRDSFVYFGRQLINADTYYSNDYPSTRVNWLYKETEYLEESVKTLVENNIPEWIKTTGERGYFAVRNAVPTSVSLGYTKLQENPTDPIYRLIGVGLDAAMIHCDRGYSNISGLIMAMGLAESLGYYSKEVFRYCFSFMKLNILSLEHSVIRSVYIRGALDIPLYVLINHNYALESAL